MSPLTKLFVVLLVIVSMLLAAASVVFVTKTQPLQPEITDMKNQLDAERQAKLAADRAEAAAEGQARAEAELRRQDNITAAGAETALQGRLNEANVTIASLQGEKANLLAGLNTANNTMQLTSSTANKLQEQLTALRVTSDNLLKQNDDFARRNAVLTSTNESLQARLQDTQEQLATAKDTNQKYADYIKSKGFPPDEALNAPVAIAPGAPAINGTVRNKSVINGNTFVTISVGSADGVVKGMKFDVVSGPDYLGTITIDTVDTEDSIGRLEGPRVSEVQKGNEVTTQIRGS